MQDLLYRSFTSSIHVEAKKIAYIIISMVRF